MKLGFFFFFFFRALNGKIFFHLLSFHWLHMGTSAEEPSVLFNNSFPGRFLHPGESKKPHSTLFRLLPSPGTSPATHSQRNPEGASVSPGCLKTPFFLFLVA